MHGKDNPWNLSSGAGQFNWDGPPFRTGNPRRTLRCRPIANRRAFPRFHVLAHAPPAGRCGSQFLLIPTPHVRSQRRNRRRTQGAGPCG